MTSVTADVAIVGAGPAGAWAAYLLAKKGARVVLVDPSHPREKPCGGGVTGRALALASAALGPSTFPAVAIQSARFVDTRSSSFAESVVSLPGRALVVASRATLDGTLLDAAHRAGASLMPVRARRIERRAGTFEVILADGCRLSAGCLIGADGANSLTRRSVAAPFSRAQLSVAAGFFAHGVTSSEIVIELRTDPPGYLWSFPRPDHLAIGICAQADAGVTPAHLKSIAEEWIVRASLTAGAPLTPGTPGAPGGPSRSGARGVRLEPYSWPIPSLSSDDFERLEPAGDGWYLVGDAAGLVDPITREGIYFALQSAQFAADAIAGASPRARQVYTDRVRTEIAADLAHAAALKALFFGERFRGLFLSALSESEPIRRVMADLVTGSQSYRTLKWRLASTLEFGLAWRLLTGRRQDTAIQRCR